MEEIPSIEMVMTREPRVLDFERPAHEARQLMSDLAIRHIPIVRGSQLIGILSERDLRLSEILESKLNSSIAVGDLCHLAPYCVEPHTKLDVVLQEMARQGLGSALVVENGKLLGIYTNVDACQGYADLLRSIQLRGA